MPNLNELYPTGSVFWIWITSQRLVILAFPTVSLMRLQLAYYDPTPNLSSVTIL